MYVTTRAQRQTQEYKQALRADLLALAGIDIKEQAKGISLAWNRLKRHLHSRKLEVVSYEGVVQRVMVPDNNSQLRAAEAILHMTGANATKSEGESGEVHITIQFPAACQPTQAIDVTPGACTQIAQAAEQAEECLDGKYT